jgi:CPA1 family monovalent cation:H+ antiporter
MWTVTTFLLESLAFILVGIELPLIVHDLDASALMVLVRESVLVFACMVLARIIWVFPSTYVGRGIGRWMRRNRAEFPGWRPIVFVGWAGVRGGDSLVIALALPFTTAAGQPFPARDRIIFITFGVILLSLVGQAPTLRPLARVLGLESDSRADDEEAHARLTTAEAALRALDDIAAQDPPFPEVARYLRQRYRQRARRWAAQEAHGPALGPTEIDHRHSVTLPPSHQAGIRDDLRAAEYERLRGSMIAAERRALLALRDAGTIGDDVMATVQRELDFEQIVLEGSQPVVESPREVTVDDATHSRRDSAAPSRAPPPDRSS